jgi:lipopolysaccharide cholinephosphotransferase
MVDLNIQLPESFFQEEERSGYLVSAKTKELWAVQLDLLNEFDRVCKKHNLKYILDFGTLLGAVRHKGFIPWDDDVDVSMLREDYEKLILIAPKEFKEPYFFQTPETDYSYDDCVTKLRRSDTCFFTDHSQRPNVSYNQGIFIDIFVLDNVPNADLVTKNQLTDESIKTYREMRICSRFPKLYGGVFLSAKIVLRYLYSRIRYGSCLKIYKHFDEKAKNRPYSGFVGTVMFMKTHCRSLSDYGKIIEMQFENLMLPVPEGYDKLLELLYGDYMTPVIGGAGHETVFFDVNSSYLDIIKFKKGKNKINHSGI